MWLIIVTSQCGAIKFTDRSVNYNINHCQLDHWEQIQWNVNKNTNIFGIAYVFHNDFPILSRPQYVKQMCTDNRRAQALFSVSDAVLSFNASLL